jgi:hypothetical protein
MAVRLLESIEPLFKVAVAVPPTTVVADEALRTPLVVAKVTVTPVIPARATSRAVAVRVASFELSVLIEFGAALNETASTTGAIPPPGSVEVVLGEPPPPPQPAISVIDAAMRIAVNLPALLLKNISDT